MKKASPAASPKSSSTATIIAPGNAPAPARRKNIFPLKYKFLAVLMFILLSSLSVFFYVVQRTFSEDKKLFVMDLNLSVLKAATSDIKMELKSRLEELQLFVPRIYSPVNTTDDPYQGLSPKLREELLAVEFLRKENNGTIVAVRQYLNTAQLEKKGIDKTFYGEISNQSPISQADVTTEGVEMRNRSFRLGDKQIGVLTFIINGTFLNSESKNLLIAVDYSQDFLRQRLQQSDLAELFLIFKKGTLLSHPSLDSTVTYANTPFPHPIVERMKEKVFTRESLEVDIQGEPYLCNLSETGFPDVMAVSQTRKSEAFVALRTLFQKTFILALIILSAAVVVSIFFASGLTANIKKLKEAAEQIGAGHLDTKIAIRSNDEITSVAESFQWMADRLKALVVESTEKARLEDELETARLVQSTLLSPPKLPLDAVDIVSHYSPATECGGDYWDASISGNLLTVFIGDATGHGAPAAIVTAVAKSCFSTLNTIYADKPLAPEEFLSRLNAIIFNACQGKLLMTMCVLQLDLATGELTVANAGHESPLRLRINPVKSAKKTTDKKKKSEIDVVFARGERLGFNPQEFYQSEKTQLDQGDIVLLYTDGISEARNAEGKEWGERALKKAFAESGIRPLAVVRKQLVSGFERHTGKTPQADDVTFVLLSWKKATAATGVTTPSVESAEVPVTEIPLAAAIEVVVAKEAPKEIRKSPVMEFPKEAQKPLAMPPPIHVEKPMKAMDEEPTQIVKANAAQLSPEEEKAKREAYLFEGREWEDPTGGEDPPQSAAA